MSVIKTVFFHAKRNLIHEIVSNIVKKRLDKKMAVAVIKRKSSLDIPSEDQTRFLETVEIELRSLHEGNIARYKLRSSEYKEWNKVWKTP